VLIEAASPMAAAPRSGRRLRRNPGLDGRQGQLGGLEQLAALAAALGGKRWVAADDQAKSFGKPWPNSARPQRFGGRRIT
jgi:hypothetical protein